jgi:hypothetical protein
VIGSNGLVRGGVLRETENLGGFWIGEHAEEIFEFAIIRPATLVLGKPVTRHKDLAEAFECRGLIAANGAASLSLRDSGKCSLQVGLFRVWMGEWLEFAYELMRAQAASRMLRTRWGQGMPTAFRGHFRNVNWV